MSQEEAKVLIREIEERDAEAFIALLENVYAESDYLLLEPDELNRDPGSVRQYIRNYLVTPRSTIFVAEEDGTLLGFLSTKGEAYRRVRHRVTVGGLAVLADRRKQGIGTQLCRNLFAWGRRQGIFRIELSVITKNEPGVALCRKVGFDIEGVKLHAVILDNQLMDEYLLVKFLDDDDD